MYRENHNIHKPRVGPHENRERVHQDVSGQLPRDPNRPGHVARHEPEHKYESLKSGSHTYEDMDSVYYLDVLPDSQIGYDNAPER